MKLRDDLELSVLAEFGDPNLAEIVGVVYQQLYETLCDLIGIPAETIDQASDILDPLTGGDL